MKFFSGIMLGIFYLLSAAPSFSKPQLVKHTMAVDEWERSYYLYYPKDMSPEKKYPLLMVLHGGGPDDGDDIAEQTRYDKVADQYGFIVVYPNGVKGKWNDGREQLKKGFRKVEVVDDVGFLSRLIDHLIASNQVNKNRVYVTGVSNGGMMTMRLACDIDEKLAAVAPVIANMPLDLLEQCKPKNPLPFLLMNGTNDPLMPWQGGKIKLIFKNRGEVLSTEATLHFWLQHNQCSAEESVEQFPDINKDDDSRVSKTIYTCKNNVAVVLYTVHGGGHTWPQANIPSRPLLLGKKNMDINAAEEIWKFLSSYLVK